jgi:hypothetical protein
MAKKVDSKKHLDKLAKSDQRLKEAQEQRAIQKTLFDIVRDIDLWDAVIKYGQPIKFAEGYGSSPSFHGYSHLEIDPKIGFSIVIRELNYMADHMNETHDSKYQLYITGNAVFFRGEYNKEINAAEAVRHRGVSGCNVDYSRAQTAKGITDSLEKAVAKIIK